MLLSCSSATKENKIDSSFNKSSSYQTADDNHQLQGTWVVTKLDIPDCKLCKEQGLTLNKIWNHELNIRDTFFFQNDSLFYKSIDGQGIAERFRFKDSSLAWVGSDWVFDMDVKKHTPNTLTLAIGQQYVSEINSTEEAKDLIVNLTKTN